MKEAAKKPWAPPAIHRYGAFATTTQDAGGCDKKYGSSDGFTFAGQPIVCTS